ncbi:MAG: hypothetical protein CVU56_21775 [Deltaproteobacteria bacterium HGW-Deltaproteobacteria-14]|jgi:hypothetical protein|nr:MAG: hypothetical protein CVU56_21775 [Deltaproteobacteria bacterium HGW-Deltaproteobacteria-14]
MKLATILTGLALTISAPVAAAEPQLGLSGLFDVAGATWAGLDDQARVDFFAARADLAVTLGARVVRFGAGAPDVFSESALHGTFPWLFADRVVGALAARDLDLVVTLEQLVPASQKSAYRQFMNRFVERYDGDADFGVTGAEVQFDHPDVDESGTISFLDWDADGEAKQAWASAHVLTRLEIGDRVRLAEDGGAIIAADYAGQLGAVQQAVSGTAAEVEVEVAGTDMDQDSKNRFLDRLAGVDGAELDAAGAHFRSKIADLDGARAITALGNFIDWLGAAGLTGVEPWVTEISVGSAPSAGGPGPCYDPRCSERTQVHGLVRVVLTAFSKGYTRVFYAGALEAEGTDTTVGLVTVPAAAALAPAVSDLSARPAYAVWRRLADIVAGGTVSRIGNLPTNVFGVQTANGQVFWFDWTLEVGLGQPFDPARKKEIVLRGLTSPSVRVTSLWPELQTRGLSPDGAPAVTWSSELAPVGSDGTAVVTIEQDPVWVSPSDEVAGAETDMDADVVDSDVVNADASVDAGEPAPKTSGGCQGAGPSELFALLAGAVALLMVRRRGRRA